MSATPERRIRRAALVVAAGLLVQLFATVHWTPLTFVIFAAVGAPLVVLGVVLYFAAVWRILKDREAL